MGSEPECSCFGDPRDENQEFKIKTGKYSFKKVVRKETNINNFDYYR